MLDVLVLLRRTKTNQVVVFVFTAIEERTAEDGNCSKYEDAETRCLRQAGENEGVTAVAEKAESRTFMRNGWFFKGELRESRRDQKVEYQNRGLWDDDEIGENPIR